MTHLLTTEAELAAEALASAYLDHGGTPTGRLLAGVAVQARNVGRLDRHTIGAALGKRLGLEPRELASARNRLVYLGWLQLDPPTGKRRTYTLARPTLPLDQADTEAEADDLAELADAIEWPEVDVDALLATIEQTERELIEWASRPPDAELIEWANQQAEHGH
jgi:hypothetical protein